MDGIRSAGVRAWGHPNLRATHHKTLELTTEEVVSARATCVVGVRAEFDPERLGLLRGRVHLLLRAGDQQISGEATVNPGHEVRSRIVLRRSETADSDTFAVRSTLTADRLGPEWAAQLADPQCEIRLTMTELAVPPRLVIVGDREPSGRLGLLWRQADGQHVLTSTPEKAGGYGPGDRVEVPGSPAASVLLAVGLPASPAIWLGRVDRATLRRPELASLLSAVPVPTVLTPDPDAVADLARLVGPTHRVAVADDRLDVGTSVGWHVAGDLEALLSGGARPVVLATHPAAAERVELTFLIDSLLRAGVSGRTLGDALGDLGLTRRRIYDVLAARRAD